jgi:hypothetical protein
VAVTIAVSIWMGSLTTNQMEVGSLTVTHLDFTPGSAETGRIVISVVNSETSDVTVLRMKINGEAVDTWSATTSNKVLAGSTETFTVTHEVTTTNKYSVILYSTDGTVVGAYTAKA